MGNDGAAGIALLIGLIIVVGLILRFGRSSSALVSEGIGGITTETQLLTLTGAGSGARGYYGP